MALMTETFMEFTRSQRGSIKYKYCPIKELQHINFMAHLQKTTTATKGLSSYEQLFGGTLFAKY